MTAIVITGSKAVRTTALTATQSEQFKLLAENARKAQALLLTGNQPHTIYDALARLEEMLDPTFEARMAAVPRDYYADGIEGFHDYPPMPTPAQHAALRLIRPDGDFAAAAYNLGMILDYSTHAPFDSAKDDATGAWVRWAS